MSVGRMRRPRNLVQEVHVAVLGMNGSGKSALTVKYITRRFITEYDPNIEDTYCKHEMIRGQENMVWIMDTVDSSKRDPNRYLAWADVFLVVYSITSRQSFEQAERLLAQIASHDHSFCLRHHVTCLIGNKTDLDRYRQVSKAQGTELATEFGADFFELNTTEEYSLVKSVFHHAISSALAQRQRLLIHRSPSPRHYASDSETTTASPGTSPGSTGLQMSSKFSSPLTLSSSNGAVGGSGGRSGKNSWASMGRRSKSPAAKIHSSALPPLPRSATQPITPLHQPQPKKSSPGLRIFKLFQNER